MNIRFIPDKKDQKFIFCEDYIDDRLNSGHDVYTFDTIIDKLDISSISDQYSYVGGPAYSPKTMLKIIFFGYMRAIRSARKLALSLVENIAFIYLAGDLKIKFRAIADFRARFAPQLQDIFKQTVQLGYRLGYVEGKENYQDGTKIRANAADENYKKKEDWEKEKEALEEEIEKYFRESVKQDEKEDELYGKNNISSISKENSSSTSKEEAKEFLRKKIDSLLEDMKKENNISKTSKNKELEKNTDSDTQKNSSEETNNISEEEKGADKKENNISKTSENKEPEKNKDNDTQKNSSEETNNISEEKEEKSVDKKDQIVKKASLLKKIWNLLSKNKAALLTKFLNLTDPDARFMKCRGDIHSNFNAQIICENQFITAADVTNEETDYHQLEPMVEQREENLPGVALEKIGNDAGYFSGSNLEYLANKNIDGYIPNHNEKYNKDQKLNPPSNKGFELHDFSYNEDIDEWKCPAGKILDFAGTKINDGNEYNIYKSCPNVCMRCPDHENCFTTKQDKKLGYRSIEVDKYSEYRNEMIRKMETDNAKEFYADRKTEPETVFGNMKQNLGYRYFLLRGLEKVKGEFSIMCSAHNLLKIIRFVRNDSEKLEILNTIKLQNSS